MIYLERIGSSPWGTFGILELEGFQCYTLEPAWRGNEVGRSCIPAGVYTLRQRVSPIVQRTTNSAYEKGWEVTDVPGRTYIMIHPGNWANNTEGCILPGRRPAVINGEPGVASSRAAFDDLMKYLRKKDEWVINIMWQSTEYP